MTGLTSEKPTAPYPGLRPFEPHESAIFFGRAAQTNDMLTKLESGRFLAVVGASGSGKSSLVRAGLLPALSEGYLSGASGDWTFVVARPAGAPFASLADGYCRALKSALPAESASSAAARDAGIWDRSSNRKASVTPAPTPFELSFAESQLRSGRLGLVELLRKTGVSDDRHVLILIDQFEELFRFRALDRKDKGQTADDPYDERNEAIAFVDLLLSTAAQCERPVYVVLTMRSDFLGDCDAFFGLPEAVSASQFLTPRLTRDQLAEAIEKPLEQFDGAIKSDVVTMISNEVGTNPDQLPLMQHALLQMWELARGTPRTITVETYRSAAARPDRDVAARPSLADKFAERPVASPAAAAADQPPVVATSEGPAPLRAAAPELGAIQQALNVHADRVCDELAAGVDPAVGAARLRAAECLFRCLAERKPEGQLVRRLTTVREVMEVGGGTEEVVKEVIRQFAAPGRNFLVTSPRGELTATTNIDISHESLLRQWGRAQKWIDDEADDARRFRRLNDDASSHADGVGSLLAGAELALFADWWRKRQATEGWAARYGGNLPVVREYIEESQKEARYKRTLLRGIVLVSIIGPLVLWWLWRTNQNELKAQGQVSTLLSGDTAQVEGTIANLKEYGPVAVKLLHTRYDSADDGSKAKLHAALALVGNDPRRADTALVDYLREQLLSAKPDDVPTIRQYLAPHHERVTAELWKTVKPPTERAMRLHAAAGLALLAPSDTDWDKYSSEIAKDLLFVPSFELKAWTENLRPVGKKLAPELERVCQKDRAPERTADRAVAAAVLAEYVADEPVRLARVALLAENEKEFQPFIEKLRTGKQPLPALLAETLSEQVPGDAAPDRRDELLKRQANAGICLLELDFQQARSALQNSKDPSLRSFLIQRLGRLGTSPITLAGLLSKEADPEVRQALVLALGDCDPFKLTASEREAIVEQVAAVYRRDPNSGVHSAAWWMLQHPLWKAGEAVVLSDTEVTASREKADAQGRNWFINGQRQTYVVVKLPVPVSIGEKTEGEPQNDGPLTYRFAIAAREVTEKQFQVFRPEQKAVAEYSPDLDYPMNNVTWYDAAAYCNWLTEQENKKLGDEEQLTRCYEPLGNDEEQGYAAGMTIHADFLQRTGYRLPTEEEWEAVCRAGTGKDTTYSFGRSVELLGRYAWYADNSNVNGEYRTGIVGRKLPNAWGAFDMHGNLWEWCQSPSTAAKVGGDEVVKDDTGRVLRGGSFVNLAPGVTSAFRNHDQPDNHGGNVGFRPARTYP